MVVYKQYTNISTHAPYTEGDEDTGGSTRHALNISTHAPYTEGDVMPLE